MQYLGGKVRLAKTIAACMSEVRRPGQPVWDPFCGGLSVAAALAAGGPVYASDVNAALIALYTAVRDGWAPPESVTQEQWAAAKTLPDSDPMKAFCGFGCSMSGAWFKAYAKDDVPGEPGFKSRFYARAAANALRRDVPKIAQFECKSFLDSQPAHCDFLIYCDPPYIGTTGYAAVGAFDHERFVDRVLEWSAFTHVFVSEYEFPVGSVVYEREQKAWIRNSKGPAQVEKLFHVPRR